MARQSHQQRTWRPESPPHAFPRRTDERLETKPPRSVRPVIVLGTGRCGSSLLHGILRHHSQVSWLSQLCERYPRHPRLNALAMTALDVPLARQLANRALYPDEAYDFWECYCPGFAAPPRDLSAADVIPEVGATLRRAIGQAVTRRRDRLLLKITGWPRLGFLKAIMPAAKFIYVYRDGRAVAFSAMHAPWISPWRGPGNWRWGQLAPDQQRKWEELGPSPVVLQGLAWEVLIQAYEAQRHAIPESDLLAISYEELCQDAPAVIQRAAAFADLEWTPEFERRVREFQWENQNHKWQGLPGPQRRALEEAIGETLVRWGYL